MSEITTDEVRDFIENVFPERPPRLRIFSLFADSIDYVHACGPGKWGAYCDTGGRKVRLVCGRLIVFTINPEGLWLSLDKESMESHESMLRALHAVHGWREDRGDSPDGYPRYTTVPSINIYYTPDEEYGQNWPPIRDLHFAFIERVARKYSHLATPSQKTHQPALLAYLRGLLKRDVPAPVYPSGKNAERVMTSPLGGIERAEELRAEGEAAVEPFDPHDERDGRLRVLANLVRRQGQAEFRRELIRAYRGRCAITGWAVEEVLEAAHIMPYRGEQTNRVHNGLLLRADLHVLFDLHLIEIDAESYSVIIDPVLAVTPYAELDGKKLILPEDRSEWPLRECLRLRSTPSH